MREKRSGLRSDLQITRQLTRGEPVYVVYDPVSFQAHRLSLYDYRVVSRIREKHSLQDAFSACVADDLLDNDQEAEFYRFVQNIETLGLLTTSNQNAKGLYQRFIQRRKAERKSQALSFLFVTLPLTNPDKFLDRSVRRFEFLFTRTAFIVWLVALVAAIGIVLAKWQAFVEPLNSVLATKNLLFMSLTFVGLKIWHELGHGYACKHFGGRVPEMGCKLIVGMPLAYMDATSAWSFPRRLHRILVMLGGMYFESLIAIPAVFLWAYYPESFFGSCAFQLIFMAGVATLFFNANPLMKFDGYFILSDLLEIPNLRSKATREVNHLLQRFVLGMQVPLTAGLRNRITLLTYGVSSTIYSISLMLSIAALIAVRFQTLGLILAGFQIGTMVWSRVKKLFEFLLKSKSTEAVRPRARMVAWGLGLGIPALLVCFPVPASLRVEGIVSAEKSSIVRAATSGVVSTIYGRVGDTVPANAPLAQLENIETIATERSEAIAASSARRSAYLVSRLDLREGLKQHLQANHSETRANLAAQESHKLVVRAPHDGRITELLKDYQRGVYVNMGDPIATVVSGQTIVRAYLNEEQLQYAKLRLGETVDVRLADQSRDCSGILLSVAPAKTDKFEDLAVTTAGEGSITVDPVTGATQTPTFLVRVALDCGSSESLQEQRAFLLMGRRYESAGSWIYRRTLRFVNSIFAG